MSTNEPVTQERLDEIRERLEVRTSGPWRAIICESADHPHHGNGVIASGSCWPVVDDETMRVEDADLIAHAPQDLTDLLADNERLRAENKQLRARLTVDDDMVERAAKALYLSDFMRRNNWATEDRARVSMESAKGGQIGGWMSTLEDARAALHVALNPYEQEKA